MRRRRAEVGDEQKREDPTVNELERRAAELLGQEEALFLPTATMANQIALRVLTRPGDELLAEETNAHPDLRARRAGGPRGADHASGCRASPGGFTPEQVRAAVSRPTTMHAAHATRLVENTHNSAGGRVWPLDELDAVVGLRARARLAVTSTARGC